MMSILLHYRRLCHQRLKHFSRQPISASLATNINNAKSSSSSSSTKDSSWSSSSSERLWLYPLVVTSALGTVLLLKDEEKRIHAERLAQAAFRIVNLVSTVGYIGLDYATFIQYQKKISSGTSKREILSQQLKDYQADQEKNTILQFKSKDPAEIARLQAIIDSTRIKIDKISEEIANETTSPFSKIHQRSAVRLRDMCARNKGIYIKLGQHLSMLDHIVPYEYQKELSTLLANTPRSSWDSVQRVIRQDLGNDPLVLFQSFEETPIASASLAQVHIAHNHKGEKLAVKVQHYGLAETSKGDMVVITFLVNLISQLFDGFNYNWLADEMNKNLPKELDFRIERANLKRCASYLKNFIDAGDVALPTAVDELSSKRVLVMSFEKGSYVNDLEAMEKMGINPRDVAQTVSRTFCEQMYRHGFVHCDPHEANLLVRAHPFKKGKPQVVLLDHGLYQDLGEAFRKEYCRLWQSIIMSDQKAIENHCRALNAGNAYTLLAAMLTMRPWDDIVSDDMGRLKSKNSKGEQEMLKAYAQRYFKDIVGLLGSIPSQMLLVLKTNDCLRHLDRSLGAPINTASIVASVTADVIVKEEWNEALVLKNGYFVGVKDLAKALYKWTNVMVRIFALKVVSFQLELKRAWGMLRGWWFRRSIENHDSGAVAI